MAMAMFVFLAVLVVVTPLTGLIGRCVAARLSRTPDPDAGKSAALSHWPTPTGASGGAVEFDSEDELVEIVLVASRLGGYLSPRVYQRAMASLAAQDEARHRRTTLPEPTT